MRVYPDKSLENPANTSDPQGAKARLSHILADPRYAGIQTQPSYWDQFVHWLLRILFEILNLIQAILASTGASNLPPAFWYVVLVVAGGAIIVLLVWALRSPRRRADPEGSESHRAAAAHAFAQDQFELAERLASQGNLAEAVRALARGVATRLSGEPYWETSPLTVRELFGASEHTSGPLQPVLVPFEAAVYGHQAPDRHAYERALAAAAPFRTATPASAADPEPSAR